MKQLAKECPNKNSCCLPKSQNKSNGKGDKPRPLLKSQYDKNYESISWKKK